MNDYQEYDSFKENFNSNKLLDIWTKYKKHIIVLACFLLVLIIILLIVLNRPSDGMITKYSDIERIMVINAQNYIKNNNISDNYYVSLNNLNIKIDEKLNCDFLSGVYKEKDNYYPYLMCKDYNSKAIREILEKNEDNKNYGELKGSNPYIVNATMYQEEGLKDSKYQVNIKGNDIDNGLNIVTYYINDNGTNVSELKRIVIAEDVVGNVPVLTLLGEKTRTIPQGSTYKDPGYKAMDERDGNITDKVKVTGSVDTSKAETYKITYSVTNSRGKTATTERTIIVNETDVSLDITHKVDTKTSNGKSATITVTVNGNGYKRAVLPDNSEKETKEFSYTVYKNGTYDFVIYDINNNSEVYSVKIIELDSTPPVLTCKGILGDNKTSITMTANEEIDYYVYDQEKTKESKKEYSSTLEKLIVYGYDLAGNKGTITCQAGVNMYYEIANAPVTGTLVHSATSKTLDVKIYRVSEGYLAYIWALNPYKQFNKATSDWGKTRMYPTTMINRAITENNLQNKIVVGVNASGFYEKGAWFPRCSSTQYCDVYNRTTEGALTITDGKVVRNWYYNSAVDRDRNHSVYGLLPNGKLMAWPKVNSYSEAERKALFEEIINSGVKNTFVFRPTILLDGKDVGDMTMDIGKANRQIFCQRNTNNFVFLTAPNTGSTRAARIEFLRKIGCTNAVNFDGGGSISMVFKPANGTLQAVVGNGRAVVDSAYFTE